jgi:hypothetical protein
VSDVGEVKDAAMKPMESRVPMTLRRSKRANLIVKRKDLIPFLEERPDICLRFMETLCERLRRSEALIQDAVFLNTGLGLRDNFFGWPDLRPQRW